MQRGYFNLQANETVFNVIRKINLDLFSHMLWSTAINIVHTLFNDQEN